MEDDLKAWPEAQRKALETAEIKEKAEEEKKETTTCKEENKTQPTKKDSTKKTKSKAPSQKCFTLSLETSMEIGLSSWIIA